MPTQLSRFASPICRILIDTLGPGNLAVGEFVLESGGSKPFGSKLFGTESGGTSLKTFKPSTDCSAELHTALFGHLASHQLPVGRQSQVKNLSANRCATTGGVLLCLEELNSASNVAFLRSELEYGTVGHVRQ